MRSVVVVVVPEVGQLGFQVGRGPKHRMVETLPPDRSNDPFHERMRQGHVRHGCDLLDFEHSQVGLPLVEPE